MYKIEYCNVDFKKQDNKLLLDSAKLIVNNIESNNSYYQIFKKQNSKNSFQAIIDIASKIKSQFSDCIVISMGGASLNPQMLVSLFKNARTSPKIHFLNNTDPIFFADLMAVIDIKNTAFIAISNSGGTLETNTLVGCMLKEYQKNNITDVSKRAFFLTNPNSGMLKDISTEIGGVLLPHQEGISGRYCGLSSVSLLIGLISGINVWEYLAGANKVIEEFYTNLNESPPVISASAIYYSNKPILVVISYLQKFLTFLEWYSQIIAESLGKDGKGYTPLKGVGPNDQHSMLQLYLGGAEDKLFSFFYVDNIEKTATNYETAALNSLEYLADKNLADINKANLDATISSLIAKKLPVRNIILKELSEKAFGAITCHLMLEVITLAHLMRVNPFDQPGVEMIKKSSRELVSSL